MKTVLITGANRGIGLEFCRRFLASGWRVYATCRRPEQSTELRALADASEVISVHRLDVADHAAIDQLAADLGGLHLDILINNAGVFTDQQRPFGAFDFNAWEAAFRVNGIAPVKMAEAFLPHLQRGTDKKLVNISSTMASITRGGGGACSYRASKAALNAAMNCLGREFTELGITVYLFHPGWVATDMGTAAAPLSPRQSVADMFQFMEKTRPVAGHNFIDHRGNPLPW